VEELRVHVALMPPMVELQGDTKLVPVTVTMLPEGKMRGVMLLTTFAKDTLLVEGLTAVLAGLKQESVMEMERDEPKPTGIFSKRAEVDEMVYDGTLYVPILTLVCELLHVNSVPCTVTVWPTA
jgi:hypothetical protein